ncbi:unnamed protein product [Protopolystoma xenopodis]|uniref:Uncharacterized protein n=1 Tax=Protopolystoma xenopodis TaxID=117903 RepID=A0A3S5BZ78_9PLAT|nr:unnamed protein product [Protopolystoma xenopodis]
MGITQWSVVASLAKLKLSLSSDCMDILYMSMRGLRFNLSSNYVSTEMSAVLSDLRICDLHPDTIFKKAVNKI